MDHYEKLGVFYLGRPYDMASKKPGEGLLLYNSKDLVTHSVCVGMTGSGKTGLCIGLLEEAAMDNIPSIIIDPKGDMANLLLTFPNLSPEEFRPWINEDDARRKGVLPDEYAVQQAMLWKNGLASWYQDSERIRTLKDRAEFVIYTPGSTSGKPVSILSSFSAPSTSIIDDNELLQDRVNATTSSLLGLLGISADPIRSREYILISTILTNAWQRGMDLALADLIHQINTPPFTQIGVMGLESFYPAKERFGLALQINNLLAAPGFSTWMQGEALDINNILYTPLGKPKVSIFSINHLNDSERMFFVSLLLNQVLSWIPSQSGTTSLRAILYMDEIFGYFPPIANPPSKKPLLTLLKQARAFGLGIVLATQNPVDLDYKGLSNIGTWFIGRLQTERDKMRVMEGLEGAASTQSSRFDRKAMEETLAGLGNRIFLMHNVHNDNPIVFETRWCMSYLSGPLTRNQIKQLMDPVKNYQSPVFTATSEAKPNPVTVTITNSEPKSTMPILPHDIRQAFVPIKGRRASGILYRPVLIGHSQIGFKDTKANIQTFREALFTTPFTQDIFPINWKQGEQLGISTYELETSALEGAFFDDIPSPAKILKNYNGWSKDFVDWLQRTQIIELMRSPSQNLYSQLDESERDFRIRLQLLSREKRDEAIDKIRNKYASKINTLKNQIMRNEQAVQRETEQAKQQQLQTAISVGSTLLSSFMGKKPLSTSSMGKAVTATRGAGRIMKEKEDIKRAQDTLESYRRQLQQLEKEIQLEIDKLNAAMDPMTEAFEKHILQPAKKDIMVKLLILGWLPYHRHSNGIIEPAWK